MAAKALGGFLVPERAEFIRVLCVELNRIAYHVMFLGAYGRDIGLFGTSFTWGFPERERIMDLFEEWTGERMMDAYFRVGGLAWELPAGWQRKVRALLPALRQGLRDFDGPLTDNEICIARTRNVRALSAEAAVRRNAQHRRRARAGLPPPPQHRRSGPSSPAPEAHQWRTRRPGCP
jgi:NADH-quinone oxidoreductase subunit D